MPRLVFQTFHPELDPATTVMIDGHAPGFRMISHWPGHRTPEPLRHDLTTGSCLMYAELSESERRDLMGEFSVVTNNHYDADGVLSLYSMLEPERALRHRDLILRGARSGDFAVWGGADALALELSILTDLAEFWPFTTPPYDAERLGNLSRAYERTFGRMQDFLENPFALRDKWDERYHHVLDDIDRVEAGADLDVTQYRDDDLAVVEIGRPITTFGLRHAVGDTFRVLTVHAGDGGNRYRFCYRGESWWDVVSVEPLPRVPLAGLAKRLNELEPVRGPEDGRWWSTPIDWSVPELGFGSPVTFPIQAVRFDALTGQDPPSSLSVDVVVRELRHWLQVTEPGLPVASSAKP